MAGRLAEIREDDASDSVRAIYSDIKAATGIPQVNLIFRHLAVHPEMLTWAWDAIGPLYRDGRIAQAVAQLAVAAPDLAPQAREPIWAGLADADAAQVRAILAFYNRGNPANLIGLSTLVAAARSGRAPRSAPDAGAPVPAPRASALPEDVTIPPLPLPDQIAPEALALARDLAGRQGGAKLGVVPSLYLHISLWPEAMTAVHRTVLPIVTTAKWPDLVAQTIAAARGSAADLAGELSVTPPNLPIETVEAYIETIDTFTVGTIPEMVIVGRVLAEGIQPHRPPA